MEQTNPQPFPFLTRNMLAFEHGNSFALTLVARAHTTRVVMVRGFTREGPFTFRASITGDAAFSVNTFNIPDIPIMVSVVHLDGNGEANATFAILYLSMNGTRYGVLCQGNLGAYQGLSWPNGPEQTPLQKHGYTVRVQSSDPAAGGEFLFEVPTDEWWLLKSVKATFVAAAVAVTRRPALIVSIGVTETLKIPSAAGIIISQTSDVQWMSGGAVIDDQTGFRQISSLPNDLILMPGTSLSSTTTNINAGDNWGVAEAIVEKFYSV